MKIVFLQQFLYEWQAPMIFSAIAKKKGWETVMYIEPNPAHAVKRVLKTHTDLVVFAAITSGNIDYVYKCAKIIKKSKKQIPILVGGPHVTLNYENIRMEDIDYLSIGEGELMFSLFLEYLEKKFDIESIPGIVYQKKDFQRIVHSPKHMEYIDDIPDMDRELYYKYFLLKKEKVRMFYSGRGCMYDCAYCCVPKLNQVDPQCPNIRKRDPISLIKEIKEVETRYGLKASFFQDDSFIQEKDWLYEFLPLYSAVINKPFMCMARAIDINDQIANLLAVNGCVAVGIGLETANEEIREKRLNRYESNKQIIDAVMCLKKHKIKVTTFNMLGIPGEKICDIEKTIEFNRKLDVDSAWGVLFQPYLNKNLFNNNQIKIASNFYSKLGYECDERIKLEIYQKLFSFLVKFPKDNRIRCSKFPRGIAYLLFCVHSYYREVVIWRRSFVLTLLTGIWNQIHYNHMK